MRARWRLRRRSVAFAPRILDLWKRRERQNLRLGKEKKKMKKKKEMKMKKKMKKRQL